MRVPLLLSLLACPTAAQLVLEEGFDYPQGGGIAGKASGVGWSGAWQQPVGLPAFGVLTEGFTYAQGAIGLPLAGDKRAWVLGFGVGPQAVERAVDVAAAPASLTSGGLLGAPGTELWLALLSRVESQSTGLGTGAGLSLLSGGSEVLFVGRGESEAQWRLDASAGGGGAQVTTTDSATLALLALRLQFQPGTSTATLWIDPPLAASPTLVTPTASVQAPALALDALRLAIGGIATLSLDELRAGATWIDAVGGIGGSVNLPPLDPHIAEPEQDGMVLNPADVHMVTDPMVDPNPGDQHAGTDWEIWTLSPPERVWSAAGTTGLVAVHVHLGDGTFEGSQAGQTALDPQKSYELRARHRDSSGDALTEYSPWSTRVFSTGQTTFWFPLELEDVEDAPAPRWERADGTGPLVLPGGPQPPSLFVEGGSGQLLLQVEGFDGSINLTTNPPAFAEHYDVRVRVKAGGAPLSLPASDLTVWEHGCERHVALLPAVSLPPGQEQAFWVASNGVSFDAHPGQTSPVFSSPARLPDPPWVAFVPGFAFEEVAAGFQLPVDIAFVPSPGPAPSDPLLYVSELYGKIRVVRNDGSVGTFASGLLNFNPSGTFPGSGELGVTGLAVDPATGDVFVALLRDVGLWSNTFQPEVHRFTSLDGGQTAASETTVIAFVGEGQGPSHQISNLQLLPDGTLLVHMGDGFVSSTALDPTSYRGKLLRMNLDGSAAATNPFYNPADGIDARDYTFVRGVRNPFGGDLRQADGQLYFVENGPSVDRVGKAVAGANFGWNGTDASMQTLALWNWSPATGPVDLAFVQPGTFGGSGLPATVQGHAFVSLSGPTYASGPQSLGKRIEELVFDAAGNLVGPPKTVARYAGTGKGSISGIAAGPDGLYFTTLYEETGASGPTGTGAKLLRMRAASLVDCNGNGVADECDVALGTSLDGDGDGLPDECGAPLALSADSFSLSLSAGGTVGFTLSAGPIAHPNVYLLLGTQAGTSPGIAVDGQVLPLNPSGYLTWSLASANGPHLPGTFGALAPDGSGAAALAVPAGSPPVLAGALLHHAYALFDLSAQPVVALTSNAVPLQLVP